MIFFLGGNIQCMGMLQLRKGKMKDLLKALRRILFLDTRWAEMHSAFRFIHTEK